MASDSPLGTIRRELTADRDALRIAVERVPPAMRDRRVISDRWSVAEILDHLAIIEGRVAALLAPLAAAAPPYAGGMPPSATPLDRSRATLFAAIDAAEGRDLSAVSRQHLVLGAIDGYQWLAALGGHEERHATQIHEIADAISAG